MRGSGRPTQAPPTKKMAKHRARAAYRIQKNRETLAIMVMRAAQ